MLVISGWARASALVAVDSARCPLTYQKFYYLKGTIPLRLVMILTKKTLLVLGILILTVRVVSSIGPIPLQAPYPIPGHVYESDGSVVEGAKVTITNLNTSESIFVFTNSNGEYIIELLNLPSGYSIGDHIRVDAEKNTKTGHKSLILVDFPIFVQRVKEEDGINVCLTPFKLIVKADPTTIKADGISTSTITVTLTDDTDAPIETEIDTIIKLSTNFGNITNQIIILAGYSSGIATLQSSQKTGIATISTSAEGLVSDYVKVGFAGLGSPFKVKITTNKNSIPANGMSTANIDVSLWSVNDELASTKINRTVLVESTLGALSTSRVCIPENEALSDEVILISSKRSGNATIKAYSNGLVTGEGTVEFMPVIPMWKLYIFAGIGGILGGALRFIRRDKSGSYYVPRIRYLYPTKEGKRWCLGLMGNAIVSIFIAIILFHLCYFGIINRFESLPLNNIITTIVLGFIAGFIGLESINKYLLRDNT